MKSMEEFCDDHATCIENIYLRPAMYAMTPEQLDLVLWIYHRIGWNLDPTRWNFSSDDSGDKTYRRAKKSTKRYERDPEGTLELFKPIITYWKEAGKPSRVKPS